jgi:hypothetical protein
MVMEMLRESKVSKAIATTSSDFPAGKRWLERLGFVEAAEEFQDAVGKRIYCWSREGSKPNVE